MATCDLPKYDLCIEEGSTFSTSFSMYDDDEVEIPRDLTGATAVLEIKLLTVVTTYPGTVVGNSITFTIPSTEVFANLCGEYQAEYTLNSVTTRFLRGAVDIEKDF